MGEVWIFYGITHSPTSILIISYFLIIIRKLFRKFNKKDELKSFLFAFEEENSPYVPSFNLILLYSNPEVSDGNLEYHFPFSQTRKLPNMIFFTYVITVITQ